MRTITCTQCRFLFTEADRAWDEAISTRKCPGCGQPIDTSAPPADVTPAPDPDEAGRGAEPYFELGLSIIALGTLGVLSGWFSWVMPACALAALVLFYLLGSWMKRPTRPTRYGNKKFSDFHEFLDSWPETLDRGARIFIESDDQNGACLRFRVSGRGDRKRLHVTFSRRRSSEASLQARLNALSAPFSDVKIRERRRAFSVSLPATRSYTGSVASRAAQIGFEALGYTNESRFTLFFVGGLDPNYQLRMTEEVIAMVPDFLKRSFERRAQKLRSLLSRDRDSRNGPAS